MFYYIWGNMYYYIYLGNLQYYIWEICSTIFGKYFILYTDVLCKYVLLYLGNNSF